MCNNNTIICSNLTTGTDNVVLIPNQTIKTLTNTGNYRLIIACNIPEATANYPIGYGNQNTNYTEGQFIITSCCNINPRGTVTTTQTQTTTPTNNSSSQG